MIAAPCANGYTCNCTDSPGCTPVCKASNASDVPAGCSGTCTRSATPKRRPPLPRAPKSCRQGGNILPIACPSGYACANCTSPMADMPDMACTGICVKEAPKPQVVGRLGVCELWGCAWPAPASAVRQAGGAVRRRPSPRQASRGCPCHCVGVYMPKVGRCILSRSIHMDNTQPLTMTKTGYCLFTGY